MRVRERNRVPFADPHYKLTSLRASYVRKYVYVSVADGFSGEGFWVTIGLYIIRYAAYLLVCLANFICTLIRNSPISVYNTSFRSINFPVVRK